MSVEHMWVLDIFGQHLGAGCISGVSVRPSGAVFGNINFVEIYTCIEYMLPNICWYWIYCANSWGDECKLVSFCVPFRLGNINF